MIVPAYNEEAKIQATIYTIWSTELVDEIVVVDDGSEDRTFKMAEKTGAAVIRCHRNAGKGRALEKGVRHCKGEIIAFVDADVGITAGEIVKIINPVKVGECDVAIAKFGPAQKKGGFGFVKRLSRYGVKRLTGQYVESVLSGQRAFRAEVLKHISIGAGYGAEVGMTIDIIKKGYRIQEYEVNMTHHETGRDIRGFVHRGKQMADIMKVLIGKSMFNG